jgi:hypothetical protein
MQALIAELEQKIAPGSILVLQGEKSAGFEELLAERPWDLRKYGRNLLAIWVKEGH